MVVKQTLVFPVHQDNLLHRLSKKTETEIEVVAFKIEKKWRNISVFGTNFQVDNMFLCYRIFNILIHIT